jgi:hypothetical protein
MVDNVNPNNQFHPYQPMNETPAIERSQGGLNGMLGGVLGKLGSTGGLGSVLGKLGSSGSMNDSLGKAREYARAKPGVVLGGLAALVIGAGLLRGRSHRTV